MTLAFRRVLAATLAAFLLSAANAAEYRMRASTAWAENISRSSSPRDWTDTLTAELGGNASVGRQLARGLTGGLAADVNYFTSPRFEKLALGTLGGSTSLQYKFGLGPTAPLVRVEGGLSARAAKISGDSGFSASGAVTASKRFTDSLRARASADWQRTYARNETFDTLGRRIFGELTWDITPSWSLTYGYGRQWADLVAYASPTVWSRAISGGLGAAIANYYWNVPTLETDAFGPGWTAYRVHGEAELWWLQLSPALSDSTSLSLRFDSMLTVNRVDVKYRQNVWTLGLQRAF